MRFDATYSTRHILADGTTVTLRLVQPGDRDELARQFHRMSADSRYRRFFSGIRELSEEMLDYLTVVDGYNHFAILAFTESLDLKKEAGVGVARFVRLADEPEVAEAAVTVVDDHQGRGIGRLLLAALVEAAQERGVKKFRGEVLASNEPMCKLLEAAGAHGTDTGDGTLIFDVPLDPQAHDRSSPVRRVLSAVATSMTVWLSHLYPPGRTAAPRS